MASIMTFPKNALTPKEIYLCDNCGKPLVSDARAYCPECEQVRLKANIEKCRLKKLGYHQKGRK